MNNQLLFLVPLNKTINQGGFYHLKKEPFIKHK